MFIHGARHIFQLCPFFKEEKYMNSPNVSIVRIIFFVLALSLSAAITIASVASDQPDFSLLVGEWIRPDGGYLIHVRNIETDGSVDAAYYNPSKINVAEANVSELKGLVKLFIKLDDAGYPGSTYTLYYYAEKDALAGFYYQAAIKQTFEVVFLRK
jgi:hypothetical protein